MKISGLALLRAQGLGRAAAAGADHLDARPAHRASTATPRSTRPTWSGASAWSAPATCPSSATTCTATREEDFWFIPTAEVPVTNLYRDEILDGAQLPIKHVAYTACFRREQMAAGRDVRGIKRGHQFDKVEMVKFVRPETSMDELDRPARRRRGRAARRWSCPTASCRCARATCRSRRWRRYDLEVWAPGCGEWLEVSSCSNFGDFQARRARIRFQRGQGQTPVRAHAQRLGSGAAADADRGARDLPARRRRSTSRRCCGPYLGGAEILG